MTNEELHALFDYEPSGVLRRREGTGGRKAYPWRAIGKEGRYRAATINGSTYYLHRLIYQWHHGSVPEMVDHRDGDPSNNRIENLRTCTNGQNQFNSKRKCSNASGHKGVVYHAKCAGKPWQALARQDQPQWPAHQPRLPPHCRGSGGSVRRRRRTHRW